MGPAFSGTGEDAALRHTSAVAARLGGAARALDGTVPVPVTGAMVAMAAAGRHRATALRSDGARLTADTDVEGGIHSSSSIVYPAI